MDLRHKKKAVVGITLWVVAFPLLFLVFAIGGALIKELWTDFNLQPAYLFIAVVIVQYVAFFWGGGHLAKAKGYSSGMLVVGIFWPAQLFLLALLIFGLPDKCVHSTQQSRKCRNSSDESQIARVIRYRRNALLSNLFGLLGVLFALALIFIPTGWFKTWDNASAAGIIVFLPSYGAIIYGCWWWVKAKNWPDAVVFIGLMPLVPLMIPFVRILYFMTGILPLLMVVMPLLLIGVVAALPDKSGMPKRKRWDRD